MDMTLLIGLTVCTLGGFLIGAVVGIVLGNDIAVARMERQKTADLTMDAELVEWDEDLEDPEGEWNA